MFCLYNSHPFYILSTEIDLRKKPHLRLLQFSSRLDEEEIRKSQGDVIGWFNLICGSITTKSLVVEVCGFTKEAETCNKIQDILLALNSRIETLSVYLFDKDRSWDEVNNVLKLFPNYMKRVL